MFILSYRDILNSHFVNFGIYMDYDDARAKVESEIRKILSTYGEVTGDFFLEAVRNNGSLRDPVEIVVELNEHEYEFIVDKYNSNVDVILN